MKAARIHEFGPSDRLQVEDTPRPKPQEGELLVAVRSAGINPVDWKIREGKLGRMPQPPFTSGQDFAGTVLEVTGASGAYSPGERVFGFVRGAYAEFAVARPEEIARVPDGVAFETAAALPTPGCTAVQMLRAAGIHAGSRVLVQGAGGSVGSLAVQLARRAGAEVAATALGGDIGYVASLGADPVIDNAGERFEEMVRELDAVVDLIGGELQLRSLAVLRPGGVLVSSVGVPYADEAERREVRTVAFLMQRSAPDLINLAHMAEAGELRVRIARVLPFPEVREAQELSQHGHASGKIILRVA
ncbi:MAG: NADP-dependent oxidoreductase [Terriglobales bacterium]